MIQLTNASFIANNEAVGVMPNSVAFTEGRGEQDVKAVSVGEGKTETIYSNNVETAVSMLKAQFPTTPENISLILSWKENGNQP